MKFILIALCLSSLASADTSVYRDERFIVSVEEKSSVPANKKKDPCSGSQEVFLEVRSASSKKIILSELVESCLKSIDLEDSVDESIIPLGKKIFVFQEKALGILDLTGDSPVWKTSELPPEDLKATVMKLENCHHWAGEEGTDEKRRTEIAKNLKKLGCEKLPTQIEAMKKKYSSDPPNLTYLEAAVKEYQ